MHFESWQWVLLAVAALFFGLSKTGIPGISMVSVGILANLMPAQQATGVVLPMLIFADGFAFFIYRKNLEWRRVGRLLPWAVGGVVAGWFALGRINNEQTAQVVGGIIALMLGLHVWRQRKNAERLATQAPAWFGPAMGVFAGVTTMIANAAGPVMTLYLLAMRLSKLEFLGTGAAFFLVINWIKVPFAVHLGLITPASLILNLWLLPAVAVGALLGRPLVERVNQRWFENIALGLAALTAIKLLFF
ncbi:Sulfite exporter TauE/SafE [Lacunisphaera limnophila]|uniref:Probable membrane transporter protein n=1 Tax=Lacunisphaera limnophila TaxID=1838286 RepID=A0A1D8AZ64_9BACT|nr:sulfite exporter TauE/SafE family protein [Lacunisphaera limnophila]AOS46161.1 Sulfite exporter TauE/SafE [Lacunisphaera limnophila]